MSWCILDCVFFFWFRGRFGYVCFSRLICFDFIFCSRYTAVGTRGPSPAVEPPQRQHRRRVYHRQDPLKIVHSPSFPVLAVALMESRSPWLI